MGGKQLELGMVDGVLLLESTSGCRSPPWVPSSLFCQGLSPLGVHSLRHLSYSSTLHSPVLFETQLAIASTTVAGILSGRSNKESHYNTYFHLMCEYIHLLSFSSFLGWPSCTFSVARREHKITQGRKDHDSSRPLKWGIKH